MGIVGKMHAKCIQIGFNDGKRLSSLRDTALALMLTRLLPNVSSLLN